LDSIAIGDYSKTPIFLFTMEIRSIAWDPLMKELSFLLTELQICGFEPNITNFNDYEAEIELLKCRLTLRLEKPNGYGEYLISSVYTHGSEGFEVYFFTATIPLKTPLIIAYVYWIIAEKIPLWEEDLSCDSEYGF
jgi:hypothetical protein